MNTASLELCKELYRVSDWFDTYGKYYLLDGALSIRPSIHMDDEYPGHQLVLEAPAYDLGYLLRRLPKRTKLRKLSAGYAVQWQKNGAEFRNREWHFEAETPEDCLALLATALFEHGILEADTSVTDMASTDSGVNSDGANSPNNRETPPPPGQEER